MLDVTATSPPRVVDATLSYSVGGSPRFGWSADGSALSYLATPLQLLGGPTELLIASFEDAQQPPRRVSLPLGSGEEINYPTWSADGSTLHWLTFPKTYWLDLTNPLAEPVLVLDRDVSGYNPWSPDGYRFAYNLRSQSSLEAGQLFLVDLEGGGPAESRSVHPPLDPGRQFWDEQWSASSDWLVYEAEIEPFAGDAYAVRVEGGAIERPVRLNPDLPTVETLGTAPDSDVVVFTTRPDGTNLELFLTELGAEGPLPPVLLEHAIPAGATSGPVRWLDSRRFVYQTEQADANTLWLADLREEPPSIHAVDVPRAPIDVGYMATMIPNTSDDSLRALYLACTIDTTPSGCTAREWTWLDLTNSRSKKTGLFSSESGRAVVSPDGRWAILDARTMNDDPGTRDLYALDLRGGEPGAVVRIDESPANWSRAGGAWSPTGYAFAFQTAREQVVWAGPDDWTLHELSTPAEKARGFAWRPR